MSAAPTDEAWGYFMAHHADLLDAAFWQRHKQRIQAGQMLDVFPYEASQRFGHEAQATHAMHF